MGLSQSLSNSFHNDDAFGELSPPMSSTSSSLGDLGMNLDGMASGRLAKTPANLEETPKGRKRFSKRQSKSGLTAVF